MQKRPFMDKSSKPNTETLKSVLEGAYPHYKELIDVASSFSQDWNFSKNSGWMLKVHDKKKALFYLIPLENEFKISLAIRENERNAFLEDDDLKNLHNMISAAKKYREGYALQFHVTTDDDYKTIESFIGKLILVR
jgi:hypothetical protein